MRPLSIRTRLAGLYLLILATATIVLGGGAWWLFRASIIQAADATLAARVDGTRRFIEASEQELPPEELQDEFEEFADLTRGDVPLEVSDSTGRTLCRPAIAGWDALVVPVSPGDDLRPVEQFAAGAPFRAIVTNLVVSGHQYRVLAAIPMHTAYVALNRFGWLLAGLVPTVLLLAGAGGFWLSARALQPVDRMTRDVQSISTRHLDRRIAVPAADDELRRLAVTFNELLAGLQRSFDDMVRFAAEASHELRTPVSIARTTAEIALARPRDPDQYREAFAEVLNQTVRMSALVDNLLVLARSDAGVEPPDLARIDVRDAASAALHDVEGDATRRHLLLTRHLAESPVIVRGSAESLRRLIVILLDNAVRYTPEGGHVDLRVGRVESSATIEVSDSGPGIGAEELPRIFDRFYRGSAARQLAPDGTGLGLSIAKTIVDRHGGEIAVGNAPSGQGSRLTITIPLA